MYLPCAHTGYGLSIQDTLSAAADRVGQQCLALMLSSELGSPHIALFVIHQQQYQRCQLA